MEMRDGLVQSDPLSPLYFTLLLQSVLQCTQSKLPETKAVLPGQVFVYLDDVIIVGPAEQAFAALTIFNKQCSTLGWSLNLHKSEVLSARAH